MQITPMLYKSISKEMETMLTSENNALKILAIGGETFPCIPSSVLRNTKTRIYNLYGVSEMSCWQTCI